MLGGIARRPVTTTPLSPRRHARCPRALARAHQNPSSVELLTAVIPLDLPVVFCQLGKGSRVSRAQFTGTSRGVARTASAARNGNVRKRGVMTQKRWRRRDEESSEGNGKFLPQVPARPSLNLLGATKTATPNMRARPKDDPDRAHVAERSYRSEQFTKRSQWSEEAGHSSGAAPEPHATSIRSSWITVKEQFSATMAAWPFRVLRDEVRERPRR